MGGMDNILLQLFFEHDMFHVGVVMRKKNLVGYNQFYSKFEEITRTQSVEKRKHIEFAYFTLMRGINRSPLNIPLEEVLLSGKFAKQLRNGVDLRYFMGFSNDSLQMGQKTGSIIKDFMDVYSQVNGCVFSSK